MSDLFFQSLSVNREDKQKIFGHNSLVIWLTGLSGAGKTTIAKSLVKKLHDEKINTQLLDGDNTRLGVNKDLGFSEADRNENLRRVAEISKLFIEAGNVVVSAFITPMNAQRQMIREIIGSHDYFEVFVNCTIEECESRDVKGLYKKARAGEILNFTGINAPFENPDFSDLTVNSKDLTVEESVEQIYQLILEKLKI
jgi:adenylylsulfate kinase